MFSVPSGECGEAGGWVVLVCKGRTPRSAVSGSNLNGVLRLRECFRFA